MIILPHHVHNTDHEKIKIVLTASIFTNLLECLSFVSNASLSQK